MKIAVNTRLLLKDRLEGIGWFSYETLKRMCISHPEHEFIFIFDRPYDESFIFANNVTPVVVGPQARHPFLFVLWFELSIPHILKKYKIDLFLSPDGYVSLRTKVPTISVIHDLNFEYYPKDLPFLVRHYYTFFFPLFARKSERVITVSEYSKYDIHKLYQISNDKIDVAYNGVKEIYTPIDEIKREEVKADITDGDSYFVFVGALHPRKNLVGLFKAFDLFKVRGSSSCKLVIVGSKQWWTKGIRRAYEEMKYKDSVIFLGHLSPKRLNEVVASSLAMVYVSYFEGFGIPIIEAFKAGTAVITSNVTSMPEVAGNAAFIVDPFNHHEIAEAMNKVVSSPMEREKFIAMGKERATFFTWDKTADAVWKSIEKIIPKLS